jgi:hypothetical protein
MIVNHMKLQMIFGRVVLIYQMPKVGSQTVEATLRASSFPHQILRFHYLSAASAKALRDGLRSPAANSSWGKNVRDQLKLMTRVSAALRIRRLLRACGVGIPRIEVITAAREIIGLALSSIFENYQYFAQSLELLTAEKCRNALVHTTMCEPLHDWFDLELKPKIRIDIYSKPFPIDKGYSVYENGFARVLLYRLDALDRLVSVLGDFLSCKVGALQNENLGNLKQYAEKYAQIRNSLELPAAFVRAQTNSKLMQYFYSAPEREALEAKWIGAAQRYPTGKSRPGISVGA